MALNSEKCIFHTIRIKFLGHIVENGKVIADPTKVKAIAEMKPPSNKHELQQLLGSLNFLARYYPNPSQELEPLYDPLRKDHVFSWDSQQDAAFQRLKRTLSSAPVLTIYDPSRSPSIQRCFFVWAGRSSLATG